MRDIARTSAHRASSGFMLVSGDVVVRMPDVVAILDQHSCEAAPTREFLGFCRRKGRSLDLTAGEPVKAVVVCRTRVLLSAFSSATLRRRISTARIF